MSKWSVSLFIRLSEVLGPRISALPIIEPIDTNIGTELLQIWFILHPRGAELQKDKLYPKPKFITKNNSGQIILQNKVL